MPEVRPQLLTDDIAADVWERLADMVRAEGFDVQRGWCHGANGFADHTAKVVRVLDTLPPASAAKSLCHELAHALLHGTNARLEVDRTRFEIEAESVAYLVMNHLGIDAGKYSFAYLARWSCGDLDRIKQTAATAMTCARRIIAHLETTVSVTSIAA